MSKVVFLICVLASLTAEASQRLQIIRSDGVAVYFDVEIATDEATRGRGLMHRTVLPARSGMWFDFGEPMTVRMWMKNTPLSLDMLFVTENGLIDYLSTHTQPFSLDLITSPRQARFVIEINAGEAARLDLEVGDRVRLIQP